MVLHVGHDNLITLVDIALTKAESGQIDGFSCATCECDFCAALGVNEIGYRFSGIFMGHGCNLTQMMYTSVYVGIIECVDFVQLVKYTLWFLCCCTVVKVYERFVIDLGFEQWKVFSILAEIFHSF